MIRDELSTGLTAYGGQTADILTLIILFFLIPIGFLTFFLRMFYLNRGIGNTSGMAIGLLVAAWTSCCWLLGGYIGGYPNIVPIMLVFIVFGDCNTKSMELLIVVLNFFIWPLVGLMLFRGGKRLDKPDLRGGTAPGESNKN